MANEIEMGIAVSANTEGAKKGLTELKSIIAETSKESEKQGKASEEASKKEEESAKKATEASNKTAEASKKATEAAENLAKQEASTAAEIEKSASAANSASGAIASLGGVFGTAGEKAAAMSQNLDTEASANLNVANSAKTAENAVSQLSDKIDKNADNTKKAAFTNDDFTNTVNSISPAIGGMITKLTGAMAAIEAIKMAISGLQKVANATIDTIKTGIDLQSSLEQTELKVSQAYQDYEKTAETMELVPKLAQEWGASMKEVGAAAAEVARLEQNFAELAPYIRDTQAATGKSLVEVANIVGRAMQGSARAVRQLQEQLGVSTKTLQLYGAAADEDGQIMAKTTEEQEKLKEAVKDFIAQNYGGAYLNYASTAAGATDNLSAAIEDLQLKLGGPFSDAVETAKNGLAEIARAVAENEKVMEWLRKSILNIVSSILGSLATVFGAMPGASNIIARIGLDKAIKELSEIAQKADKETNERRKKQAEETKKHEEELAKKNPINEARSKAEKAEEKAREKAEKDAQKAAEKAEKDRQKVIDALEKEAKKREEADRKAAERAEKERQKAQAAEEKRAKREEENKRKQAERDQKNAEKLALQAEKQAQKVISDAQKLANIKAGVTVSGTATATENTKTDKFAGFKIGINKQTGAWEWQPDKSKKFEGFNLVKNQDTGAWEWKPDQSKKFEGLVPYQTDTGAWAWRKSTLQTEEAEATAQATEATQAFGETVKSANDSLASASDNLTEAFKRLAEASEAVMSGFSTVAKTAENIANYNITNNMRVDNTLSAGINERQLLQNASQIAQRQMAQDLNQSAIIGNNAGFLF